MPLAVLGGVLAGTAGCESPPEHTGPWRVVVLEPDDPPPPSDYREGLLEGLSHGTQADATQLTLRTSRAPARALPALATREQAAGADLALTVTTAALAAGAQAAPAVIFTDVADPAAARCARSGLPGAVAAVALRAQGSGDHRRLRGDRFR